MELSYTSLHGVWCMLQFPPKMKGWQLDKPRKLKYQFLSITLASVLNLETQMSSNNSDDYVKTLMLYHSFTKIWCTCLFCIIEIKHRDKTHFMFCITEIKHWDKTHFMTARLREYNETMNDFSFFSTWTSLNHSNILCSILQRSLCWQFRMHSQSQIACPLMPIWCISELSPIDIFSLFWCHKLLLYRLKYNEGYQWFRTKNKDGWAKIGYST